MSGIRRSLFQRFDKAVGLLVAMIYSGILIDMAWEDSRFHTDGSPWTWILPAAGAAFFPMLGCLVGAPVSFYSRGTVRVVGNLCGLLLVVLGTIAFLFAGGVCMASMTSEYDLPPLWTWMNPLWLVTAGVLAIAASGVLFTKDGMGSELRMQKEVERLRTNRQGAKCAADRAE